MQKWKNVWITGASSGIGLELARLMAGDAEHVCLSARSQDKLDQFVASHENSSAFALDVTDANASAAVIEKIEQSVGPIDLAVLNAGIGETMMVDQFDLSKVRNTMEVNYMGVMNALSRLVPSMLERGQGHIAIVASLAGFCGLPGSAAYGPTKAALINLAETLNGELSPRGVKVTVITPGFVDTPMTADSDFPMPQLMTVEDAAQKILQGLKREDFEIAFPKGLAWQMRLLKRAPHWLYFWIFRKMMDGSQNA